jgi:hypothetical protein
MAAAMGIVRACAPPAAAVGAPSAQTNKSSRTARVLVLGGTGRVGGSTAAALSKLRPDLTILVGGRNRYVPTLPYRSHLLCTTIWFYSCTYDTTTTSLIGGPVILPGRKVNPLRRSLETGLNSSRSIPATSACWRKLCRVS